MRRLMRLGQDCIVDVAMIQCIRRLDTGNILLYLKGNESHPIGIHDATEDQFRAVQDALMDSRTDDDDENYATSKGDIE